MPCGPLWILEVTYSFTWVCYFYPFTSIPKELLVLCGTQNLKKPLQEVSTALGAVLPLGPYNPTDPTVLEVSVTEGDVACSL